MKKAFAALAFFLVFIAGADSYSAETYKLTGKAGEYALTITFDKKQPTTGKNRVQIQVMDAAQHPVTNAGINVHYYMPSLPGKPPMMEDTTTAKLSGTGYEADLHLNMKGEWKINIIIDVSGRKTEFLSQIQAR